MTKCALNACLAACVLFLPLYLWRSAYPSSDWALLAFLPLSVMLFHGYLSFSSAIFQARFRAAIRVGSPLKSILSGRIRAISGAIIFVLISIPLLAWQALVSSFLEILILFALGVTAGGVFVGLKSKLLPHFRQPFANAAAISLGTWISAAAFIPIIAWMNWNYVTYPGEIRTVSLPEAVMQGLQELPPRRGWIAEALAPMYAYEAGKLWAVVKLGSSKWSTILFSLDAALVSFVLARASIILTLLVQTLDRDKDAT